MRILFVHNRLSRFVRQDRDLLATRYEVIEHHSRSRRPRLRELWAQTLISDIVFCWFASWHSTFPVLFAKCQKKPSILAVGGHDTARLPEINYGSHVSFWKSRIVSFTAQKATVCICHSRFAADEAREHLGVPLERTVVLYLGVALPHSGPLPVQPIRDRVLTVGDVNDENRWRKGLEPFVRAAAQFPTIPFVVAGQWDDETVAQLRALATPNVQFAGYLPDEELFSQYRKARVYAQPSLHEAFGLSVAEAMLAGCIPAVTRVGALPEVVGDCGVYAASNAPEDVAEAIRQAWDAGDELHRRAQERVQRCFSVEQRKEGLFAVIDQARQAGGNNR